MKLRSRTFVLIYKALLDKNALLEFLQDKMKVKSTAGWTYIIKVEEDLRGEISTIVFCDLIDKPYITIDKLRFYTINGDVEPEVHVWNSSFLMRYVLTFCGEFDPEQICTNMQTEDVLKNARILQACRKTELPHVQTSHNTQHLEGVSDDENLLNVQQIVKFTKHYEDLKGLSQLTATRNTVDLMGKKLNNMLNFKNKYRLTVDLMAAIDHSRDLIRKAKESMLL